MAPWLPGQEAALNLLLQLDRCMLSLPIVPKKRWCWSNVVNCVCVQLSRLSFVVNALAYKLLSLPQCEHMGVLNNQAVPTYMPCHYRCVAACLQ